MDSTAVSKSKTPLQSRLFHTLLGFGVFFSLITIPAEAQIISLFKVCVSSDLLWWPIVFFTLYLIKRVYGFGYLRHSVYLIIIFRVIYLLFLKLAIWLPSSSFWKMQIVYTHVLGKDFLYIVKSSIIIWFCALVPIKLVHNQYNKIISLVALILFTTLNTMLINANGTIIKYNVMVATIIFCILMIFSRFLITTISNVERLRPYTSDYALLKFSPSFKLLPGDKFFKYHHILFCASIVFFIASKTMASKFISIGFFTINVGGIVFSLSYLSSDIMTDVYGIERTKQMILFVIFTNFLFVFDVWITNLLSINIDGEFGQVLHNQARMFFSSGVAFFFGMTVNSSVISILKARQKKRGISLKKEFITTVWTRVAASSSFGIILDVSLFSLVSFYNIVPSEKLISIVFFEDIYKISYEIILAPLAVLLIYALKVTEKVDVYDTISNLNPFKINTGYNMDANRFHENYSSLEREK